MNLAVQQHLDIVPKTKVEHFFRLLYGEHMREIPRQRVKRKQSSPSIQYDKQRPWVFVGSEYKLRPASTFSTLFGYLWDETKDSTYFTPNSFYRSDSRRKDYARWIHAIVVEIDVIKGDYVLQNSGLTLEDVLNRVKTAGLPIPSMIVKSPSGGFHVYWILESPIRATPKSIRLYEAIQGHIAEDLLGDRWAVGVERLFRTPKEDSIQHFQPENLYKFQVFVDWRDINHPYEPSPVNSYVEGYDIMRHPGIRELYNMDAPIGQREAICFTLTLAMKFSGWPESQALEQMERWWKEACEKGGSKPFTLKDTLYRVRRTYRVSKLKGPKSETVRHLTGIDFYYDRLRYSTPRKTRENRKYSYQVEWKNDLLALLESSKGSVIASMEKIAAQLGCAVSSLKNVLQTMQQEGLIDVHTRRGRNGSTTIQLVESVKIETAEKADIAEEKNSQINNTIGEAVGGCSLLLDSFLSTLYLLRGPYSVDFIDFIQLLHLAEINILHPFREGNGRVQREFIRYLGLNAGYEIRWSNVDRDTLLNAMIQSVTDTRDLVKVFDSVIVNREPEKEFLRFFDIIEFITF